MMATSLFDLYPHSEAFRLKRAADGSGGEIVLLPVHQRQVDYLYLAGSARIAALDEALEEEGLKALPPTDLEAAGQPFDEASGGSGIVGIYLVRVFDGDVGPYQEIMTTIKVEQRVKGVEPKDGWFVWDIKLDSDLPLRYGREYWGYDKSLAEVTSAIAADGSATFHFAAPDASGTLQPQLEGTMACTGLVQQGEQTIPAVAATPYALRRSWQGSLTRATIAVKPFDEQDDAVTIHRESSLGGKLVSVGFRPRYWMTIRNGQVVAFKGDEEIRELMAPTSDEARRAALGIS